MTRPTIALDLFFKGMENKETWASAWLATLLRDSLEFVCAIRLLVELWEQVAELGQERHDRSDPGWMAL